MTDDRRERYAEAMRRAPGLIDADPLSRDYLRADAAMAVADAEQRENAALVQRQIEALKLGSGSQENARLRAEVSRLSVQLGDISAVLDEWYSTSDASALSGAIRTVLDGGIND